MIGICLISLFGFVALAVDLGMLAVSRTQCQNGSDVAALVGTRTLNNKDGVLYSNLPAAVVAAQTAATNNPLLSANLPATSIYSIEAGQYLYDPVSQTFRVSTWTNVTGGGAVSPPSGSWTALRVTLSVAQPTYFMRVFGVTSMPSGARATAVFRPRDVAFVLDMTGSMKYSSTFNSSNTTTTNNYQSLNPDTLVPSYGHYNGTNGNQSYIVATANLYGGSGEAIPRNNYCISTPGGPPLIRGFYFDPTNVTTPATVAFPLSTQANGSPNLINAFHRWSPPESGGNSTTYTGVTYNFTGYNAFNVGTESPPMGPTPAPDTFGTQTDGAATYVGDRARRRTGAIDKATTNWSTGNNQAAYHAADLLGYTSQPAGSPAFAASWLNFRDPVWETYGYDLDIAKYRTTRGAGNPLNPATYLSTTGGGNVNNILVPAADRFVGYSMGPGYWGKTFYMWPPDPRFDATANVLSPDPNKPGYDTAGKQMCDWRRHFFLSSTGTPLDPQADNNLGTPLTVDPINPVILNTGGSGQTITATSGTQVNYAAILKWIKTGPQTLPPNLRAGRVLYYSSIPDDVNTAVGTAQQVLDKAFWRYYIDFTLGIGNYTSASYLYGTADSWSSSPASLSTSALSGYQFTWEAPLPGKLPYMRYTDSPRRPRLHMWFGPLSMVAFLTSVQGTSYNWLAGTTYEAHSWQLKAGMNSVLDDVKGNHPNDYAGLVFFSSTQLGVRVALSQNYTALKNALFYPQSLYPQVNSGDVVTELRPYTNTSLTGYVTNNIPNAGGSTDPDTGLAYAYNVLSPSTVTAAQAAGTGNGRRGAQKIIIFETDGVPNSYRALTFNKMGYNSYYTTGSFTGAGNGDATSMSDAYSVIQQIVKPMATTAVGSGTGADSGLSLPNAPARVYPIAFGDLFDPVLAPSATFRPTAEQFLANCAYYGGTGPSTATTLPSTQIITGPYAQRITNLRNCMQQIFQSGVSVALVE